jgi:ubiquinone/menaquinone biosynthesis C-methylase UbiE
MMTTTPPISELKQRMKAVWMAGDFGKVAPLMQHEGDAFVERGGLKPGMKVLDVGCGTGNQLIPAARTGAQLTGVDIAPNLLVQAAARAQQEELKIDFKEADAEQLPFQDGEFDVVMSMFAAIFAPRPSLAAAELKRVCRKGGLIAMGNWTPSSFVAEQLKITSRYAPPPPGMESPMLWGEEAVVRERFRPDVELSMTKQPFTLDIPMPPHETEAHFRQHIGPTQVALRQLDAEKTKAFVDEMTTNWVKLNQGGEGRTVIRSEYLDVHARPN